MVASTLRSVLRLMSLSWLTGPIFDKELRVVSRRRRHYLLRSAYLVLLSIFTIVAWVTVVEFDAGAAGSIYKMSAAGKKIIGTICWFQFLALQLVAVILMSTSISDEVYHGTLGVLMSTPVSSLQIVIGKLLSKMLHLAGLLAVSLPLLAVVRVFGGVPWGYVIASGCITLTAALFAGAVAMFFSSICRRAYASILLTLAVGFGFHVLVPWILGTVLSILAVVSGGGFFLAILVHLNPFSAMGICTWEMASPGSLGSLPFPFFWPAHCIVMLGLTVGVLIPCVRLVRRASLRAAFGGKLPARRTAIVVVAPPPLPPRPQPTQPGSSATQQAQPAPPPIPAMPAVRTVIAPSGPIRRITGSPVVWKKLRTPMLPGTVLRIVSIVLALALLGLTYFLMLLLGALDEAGTHAGYAVVFVLFGIISTTVFAATSISSEKETRTLHILLTTPLSNWHIIGASVLEVLRRSLPVWLFLIGHVVLFTVLGFIHPIAWLHLGMLMVWVFAFLTGVGLYFSSRFKRTTPAVVMNLGVVLGLWAVVPLLLSMVFTPLLAPETGVNLLLDANPIVQAGVLTAGAGEHNDSLYNTDDLEYSWASGQTGPGEATAMMFVFTMIYSAIGFLFLWRAKVSLRRNLF